MGFMTSTASILVAEKSDLTRSILDHSLRAEGFEPLCVPSVQEALLAFRGASPAAAVIEAVLTDGEGLRLCRTLREEHRLTSMPIVMLCGAEDDRDAIRRAPALYDFVFEKPFSMRALVSTLRELLGLAAA